MKCLIVDDEEIYRMALKRLIQLNKNLVFVGECSDAAEAYDKILNADIDLIFLDINMPGIDGLELAKMIENHPANIIFTTSFPDYAIDAFELNVVDYLLKPILPSRFLQAIQKVEAVGKRKTTTIENDETPHIFLRDSISVKQIRPDDISYLEASGDYVKINVSGKIYSIRSSLTAIQEKLPRKNFFRVHRSFMVNLDKVEFIEGKNLICGGKVIPVSNSYSEELNSKIKFL